MLELFAAIQSVDPPSLVLWGLVLFAAGMYPIGFMIGSTCSPCCAAESCDCAAGELPETLTVSVSGFQDGTTKGPDLIGIRLESNFGSGATAKATLPGGDPDVDAGPLSGVEITNSGSGYARVARVAPSVSASVFGVSGAVLTVSLVSSPDTRPGQVDRLKWSVSSVEVVNSGSGRVDEVGSVEFSAAVGDTVVTGAAATYAGKRVAPHLLATASGTGNGAELSVSVAEVVDEWTGQSSWSVGGVSALNGGTGYEPESAVTITIEDGTEAAAAYCLAYADEDGRIVSVVVVSGGAYYDISGIQAGSISVQSGGVYYREDPELPRQSATISVSISQSVFPATGAVATATVDTDPESPTYGKVTALTIVNGGTGYLAWAYCEMLLNGVTATLDRETTGCIWFRSDCQRVFTVRYRGPALPPVATVAQGPGCIFSLTSATLIPDCSSMSFVASDDSGRSLSVSAGGEQHPYCATCSGYISVRGVQVKIDPNLWTLVTLEPQMIPDPCLPTVPALVQSYGFARASAECVNGHVVVTLVLGAAGIRRGCVQGIIDDGSIWDPSYNDASIGDTISGPDPWFLPFNIIYSSVTATLDYGPVSKTSCVGSGSNFITSYSRQYAAPVPPGLEHMQTDPPASVNSSIACGAEYDPG
jgi:hypothetical protein